MKLKADECLVRVLGYQYGQAWANIGRDLIWESNDVKLLLLIKI